jgi:hypothetical protein
MTKFRKFNSATTKLITGAGALALIAGLNLGLAPQAFAYDCLLDTNNDGNADSNIDTVGGANSSGFITRLACGSNASAAGSDSTAVGRQANAAGSGSTALGNGASSAGSDSTALGSDSSAVGSSSTAMGHSASAAGDFSTAIGRNSGAVGIRSTAMGEAASSDGSRSIALGVFANASGEHSAALGYRSDAGLNAVALGGDSSDADIDGAQALGDNSIVIGVDADDNSFPGAVIIGAGAAATEANQVILKSADTFTILGNGDVGFGTAAPAGNLDVDSGADDTFLLLSNTAAQWAIKVNAANGRMTIGNNTTGAKPFKFGPNGVGNLLQVGIIANDQVDIKGNLVTTGTVTTGGPTCGGGCDAVFGADYDLPSIEEHAAQMYANSYLPQVGPTVPHAPMNISERYGNLLNEVEKAHIYIAELNRLRIEEKQAFEDRLERLEALLGQ